MLGHSSDSEMVAIGPVSVPSDRSLQTPLSAALRCELRLATAHTGHCAAPDRYSLIVEARASAEAVVTES